MDLSHMTSTSVLPKPRRRQEHVQKADQTTGVILEKQPEPPAEWQTEKSMAHITTPIPKVPKHHRHCQPCLCHCPSRPGSDSCLGPCPPPSDSRLCLCPCPCPTLGLPEPVSVNVQGFPSDCGKIADRGQGRIADRGQGTGANFENWNSHR